MKFQVIWKQTAELELANLWSAASDRQAITTAADQIDHQLRHTPEDVGESREGTRRILREGPLGVDYEVSLEDCRVFVMRVWRASR
jgi:hypothetical protein